MSLGKVFKALTKNETLEWNNVKMALTITCDWLPKTSYHIPRPFLFPFLFPNLFIAFCCITFSKLLYVGLEYLSSN